MQGQLERVYRDAVEVSAQKVFETATDPTSRDFVDDILYELRLKRELFAGDIPADDIETYSPVKRVGPYILVHQTARRDWEISDGVFQLKKGDPYINFHIPPGQYDIPAAAWTEGYQQAAQYIVRHDIPLTYWLGITYGRLASIAGRAGYTNIPLNVGWLVQHAFEDICGRFLNPSGSTRPPGELVLCYQTRGAFLQRFGSHAPAR